MGNSTAILAALLAGWTLLGCGGKAISANEEFKDITGEYRWFGTRLVFSLSPLDKYYGDLAELMPMSLTSDLLARLYEKNQQLYLSPAFCPDIPLIRNGSILTASNVTCLLPDIRKQLGVKSSTIRSLRIDLTNNNLYDFSEEKDISDKSSHIAENASFVKLDATRGAGGSDPVHTTAGTYSDAVEGYQFERNGTGFEWDCDAVVGNRCAESAVGVQSRDPSGAVFLMKDGRYYVEGYDCYAEQGYDGPPIQCGRSLAEFPRGDLPEIWLTRLLVQDQHLSFNAELRRNGLKLYVVIETPLKAL